MKKILYILLYGPYIEWKVLTNWISELCKRQNNIIQFLFYYKKVWLANKNIWHVEDHFKASVLTNCALESYHRRLNSTVMASPSLEEFSQKLYSFDMKNLRELKTHQDQILKYQKFLLKKDTILDTMNRILEDLPLLKDDDAAQQSTSSNIHDAEEWCIYDENKNDLITETMFGENLDENSTIIDSNIDKILDQFNQQQ